MLTNYLAVSPTKWSRPLNRAAVSEQKPFWCPLMFYKSHFNWLLTSKVFLNDKRERTWGFYELDLLRRYGRIALPPEDLNKGFGFSVFFRLSPKTCLRRRECQWRRELFWKKLRNFAFPFQIKIVKRQIKTAGGKTDSKRKVSVLQASRWLSFNSSLQ